MEPIRRTIAVVTGTRAEYGLLRWLMGDLRDDPRVSLKVVVSGAHLCVGQGETWREIVADGFDIDARVEMQLASDTGVGTAKSVGLGTIGFADAFDRLRPDLLIVLGDRFEALAAVQAAMALRIPIAHIHGGEATEGLWDEAIRHAITKMSHLHFVAAAPFKDRVVQLGEHPDRVFVTGAPGLDATLRLDLLERGELARSLGWDPGARFFVVTHHPVTLSDADPADEIAALFAALDQFSDHRILATRPNLDAGGGRARGALDLEASRRGDRVMVVDSLGQHRYLSAVKSARCVVGNSSSGLIEAPALGTPTVNIGSRQQGRLRGETVIDCGTTVDAISDAVGTALGERQQQSCRLARSPYGDGDASRRISEQCAVHPLDGILVKSFFDLEPRTCALP